MEGLINPILLYAACGLGALGLALAMPRKKATPQLVGALIGAVAMGGLLAAMAVAGSDRLPNVHFYIFALISIGAALRVITHPRPVYAALYFVLTVVSGCGLFVLLSAEFMAFALVIVYAGAILITYLFVIMLATEAPSAEEAEVLPEYDRAAREPVAATMAAFVVLAALLTVMNRGGPELVSRSLTETGGVADRGVLGELPRKVERALREARPQLMAEGEALAKNGDGTYALDPDPVTGWVRVVGTDGGERTIPASAWPEAMRVRNVEGLAFDLIAGHPGAIEIAGVILLMAMVGAVVLARKKVEIDEARRAERAGAGGAGAGTGAAGAKGGVA